MGVKFKNKMKVAIIGLGCISQSHIHAIKQQGSEIVGLCDIKSEKCERANLNNDLNAKIYSDYKQMLLDLNPDIVHVCTPHYLHAEMIIFALNNGVNVLCEKPLAISFEQLQNIENAVKCSNAQLGVCHQNRYNAPINYVKQLIQDEQVVSAYGNLAWQRDDAYYKQDAWRGKWNTEGGGVMINQALHTLDLLQWVVGFPKTCIATISNNTHKNSIEVEDTAFGLFSSDNFNFVMNATNCVKQSFPISMSFVTKNKTISIIEDNVVVNGENVDFEKITGVVGKQEWGYGHVKLIKDFYNCIETNKEFSINFYEAKKVIELILAMYQSNGNQIDIV